MSPPRFEMGRDQSNVKCPGDSNFFPTQGLGTQKSRRHKRREARKGKKKGPKENKGKFTNAYARSDWQILDGSK